jgi:hypothetical protein
MNHKSYPKIPAYGYDGTEDILDGDVVITPKIDGSNVSVWLFDNGYKLARRNGWISEGDKGFSPFIDFVRTEWESNLYLRAMAERSEPLVLFGEFANNQNKLKYDTKHPIILFDVASTIIDPIDDAMFFDFWPRYTQELCAQELGWPIVPVLYEGPGSQLGAPADIIDRFLNRASVLGGCNEEGVVVKSYKNSEGKNRYTRFGRHYFCKLVTSEFAERQNVSVKPVRVGTGLGEWAVETFFTSTRLDKAVQKMQEDGVWDDSNARKNIGKLIGYVSKDVKDEHFDEISEKAVQTAWKEIGTAIAKAVAPALDEKMRNESNGDQDSAHQEAA